jgi:hypothetical protein
MVAGDAMTEPTPDRPPCDDQLAALARARIAAARTPFTWRGLTPEMEQAAAGLLADVWAAGERHGVSPETWSWVADLPACVLSLVMWRALGRTDSHRGGR